MWKNWRIAHWGPFLSSRVAAKLFFTLKKGVISIQFNVLTGYYPHWKVYDPKRHNLLLVFLSSSAITGFYYVLLRFITDITGLFLRILLTFNQDPKKAPKHSYLRKNCKNWDNLKHITEYYGYYENRYYGILRNITVRNISPSRTSDWKNSKIFPRNELHCNFKFGTLDHTYLAGWE